MPCTEAYKEHVIYAFYGFCKVVIHNAAITAWRDQQRRHKREISLEYLTEEKEVEKAIAALADMIPLEAVQPPNSSALIGVLLGNENQITAATYGNTKAGNQEKVSCFLHSFMDFSLLFRLEFFVIRKMESGTTINHPLCGCATEVIQKLPFLLQ